MVTKPGERFGEAGGDAAIVGVGGGLEFSDEPLFQAAGGSVDKPGAGDHPIVGAERFTKNLQPGADRQDGSAGRRRFVQTTVGVDVFRGKDLGGVFATAEAVHVEAGGDGVAKVDAHNVCVEATHAGALA